MYKFINMYTHIFFLIKQFIWKLKLIDENKFEKLKIIIKKFFIIHVTFLSIYVKRNYILLKETVNVVYVVAISYSSELS